MRVVRLARARRAARGGTVGAVTFVLLPGARGAAAGNLIGDAGAAAIAEALKVNKTFATINLSGACRVAGAPAAGPWAAWLSCCSR